MFSRSTFAKASLVLKRASSLALVLAKSDRIEALGFMRKVFYSMAFMWSYESSGVSFLRGIAAGRSVILRQGRVPSLRPFMVTSLLAS